MRGINEYKTRDGVHVLRVHYTADPNKIGECEEDCYACSLRDRCTEWRAIASKGMTKAAWEQEMEINATVFRGKAWYPEFRYDFHVAREPIKHIVGKPIIRGWDYGLTPATVFIQISAKGQMLLLHPELQSTDCGILNHGKIVQMESINYFNGCEFSDYGDPAGNQRAQTDEKTANGILKEEYGIEVKPGPVAFEARDNAIRKLLTTTTPDGQPMLLVDPRNKWLIASFTGGYHRKEVAGRYLDVPEKNEYSHIMDATGYPAAELLKMQYAPIPAKSSVANTEYRPSVFKPAKVQTSYNPLRR